MIFVVRILSENVVYKNRKDIRSHLNLSIDRDISNFEFKKFEYTQLRYTNTCNFNRNLRLINCSIMFDEYSRIESIRIRLS